MSTCKVTEGPTLHTKERLCKVSILLALLRSIMGVLFLMKYDPRPHQLYLIKQINTALFKKCWSVIGGGMADPPALFPSLECFIITFHKKKEKETSFVHVERASFICTRLMEMPHSGPINHRPCLVKATSCSNEQIHASLAILMRVLLSSIWIVIHG